MPHVILRPVRGYDAPEALRAVVRDALALAPEIMALLAARDPARLVVVKPNWIQESHQRLHDCWEPVITHPALVLATMECLAEAMGGLGTLALCDAPHSYADFNKILARGGLDSALPGLRKRYPQLVLQVIDLRREIWITRDDVVIARQPNTPDPRGYVRRNLGRDSLFYGHPGEGRYYGADYDTGEINRHHRGGIQEYLLAGTPAQCDLFVNLPKLKTHKKTGITCCLKNLVGINGDKNWLPHHTEGGRAGDAFPDPGLLAAAEETIKRAGRAAALRLPVFGPWLFARMRRAGMRVLGDSEHTIRNGNWHGNDTCWRMALDLNRALLYGAENEGRRDPPHRKQYLAIVDGIVGGDGNGPICPDPVASGVILAGTSPAEVDAAAAAVMGFDPAALPIVRHAFDDHRWPLHRAPMEAVRVDDGRTGKELPLQEIESAAPGGFRPHFGWTAALRKG